MATLHVDLREGWRQDDVSLSVNGAPAWREDGVTTRLQIGLARQAVLQVPPGSVELGVSVEGGPRETRTLDVAQELWVGVSSSDGALEFREQPTEFGYV